MKALTLAIVIAVLVVIGTRLGAAPGHPVIDRDDLAFTEQASQDGMLEARAAELAIARGLRGDELVRAHHLLDEQSRSNADLAMVAGRKAIPVPPHLDAQHQAVLDELGTVADGEFAHLYTSALLKIDRQQVERFTTESRNGHDEDLRSLAASQLPAFTERLATADKVVARD